jgi:hypothetical protein
MEEIKIQSLPPKNLGELERLKYPIKGYTFFANKEGNLVTIKH